MSFQNPNGYCTADITGLGRVQGRQYPNRVRQFRGIPYATLSKRWTRSCLKTTWEPGVLDATQYGPSCPNPSFDMDPSDPDPMVPVPAAAHHTWPLTDERHALVLNITAPPTTDKPLPVFVYIHGGSLLFGGSHLPIFDCVNLVTHSMALGKPMVAVTINYRVGLGGFLASKCIKDELAADGYAGCGNFGLTDQQVAFDWIQRYISFFGGDPDNVTAVGESAGGISVSHQLLSARPPVFHRAICMSGLACSIPAWTLEEHEKQFQATCAHFGIDSTQVNALESLRGVSEQDVADASAAIFGLPLGSGTGNPCYDGWFHAVDPRVLHGAPTWLRGYMLGDTYHEGIIFHESILDDDYSFICSTLAQHLESAEQAEHVLTLYDIFPNLSDDTLVSRLEHLAGDLVFKIPNYATAASSKVLQEQGQLFKYHFDQRSRLDNYLKNTAYHAHELLYLFLNLNNQLDSAEKVMAYAFAEAWIKFANGESPWPTGATDWMVWGQNSNFGVQTEEEDEQIRRYSRFKAILSLGDGHTWLKLLRGVDDIVNKRMRTGVSKAKA
ncbi:uncharacterized protein N0V89_000402 [Didymosphaeria variabile]|uniref:Carboxylesterase type B domain-containing protein n=1 Tax=Didymosphaeria variabile TaxID=1932322 RepID=A0A9W8XV94_9PLEO|nr:uncharacterized protein N0V89_000402 [Didymosphaeria variabile]KAJ4359846.1 hypothetical protein N0V89_000402 [Didymosphaeria variabile]